MIFLLLLLQILNAGQVKVSPELINVNQLVTIEYVPNVVLSSNNSNHIPYLTLYYFDNNHNYPFAIDIEGKSENGKIFFTFRPDSIYTFALFKFTDGTNDDNNKFQFWIS